MTHRPEMCHSAQIELLVGDFLEIIMQTIVHRWDEAWHFLLHLRKQVMAKNRWFFSFYLCRSLAAQGAVAYLVSTVENSYSHTYTDKNSPFPVSGLPCVTSCNKVLKKQKFSVLLLGFERAPLQPLFISLWSWKWHKKDISFFLIHKYRHVLRPAHQHISWNL